MFFGHLGTPNCDDDQHSRSPTEQSQPTKTATAENLFPTTTPEVKPSLAFNIEEAPTPPGGSEFERNSPYLVYLREGTAGEDVAQVDEHGTSGWVLPSPINPETTNSSPRSLSSLVSPDGRWMAFYSGSTATGDLTLNIMKMTDGASSPITPLLSPDYPGNFDRGAAGIGSSVVTAQDLQQTFEYGITRAIAWSPDSKHLAFAGQMRGDSSDLYLWDAGSSPSFDKHTTSEHSHGNCAYPAAIADGFRNRGGKPLY